MLRTIFTGILLLIAFSSNSQELLPYQNPSLTPQERAEDLVSRLNLKQKADLMGFVSPEIPEFGIPKYCWSSEALHGAAFNGTATVFPQAIAMAASWNPDLLHDVFDAVSTEQRIKFNQARRSPEGVGMHRGLHVWTPNINIFRDPRWGRGQETYGEDPYLMTVMGREVVNGLQGDTKADTYDKLHACLKHFAIHSGPEYKRHVFNAENISHRDLQETYLYAFEQVVRTTDVKQVMCAYSAWDGKPCCGHDKLLIKILRDQWSFDGVLVTDCWAVSDFYEDGRHNIFPKDVISSVAYSVMNGSDLECGSVFYLIEDAVKSGKLKEETVDAALTRVLKSRFELGELDPMDLVPWCSLSDDLLCCDAHHELALEMARESMTLLQNKRNILPLKKDGRYAVTGPNAADSLVMWANYNGTPRRTITVLDGIREKLGAENVVYVPGCAIAAPASDEGSYTFSGNANDTDIALKVAGKQLADTDLSAFDNVDAIIFVGGISAALEGEEHPVPFEGFKGGDRTSIELPSIQRAYIESLKSAGKPIIFVNMSGSAIAMAPETENCDAILQAWYGGECGGQAVADVLFGDYNPAGRLPVTFYASDSQLPDYEDYNMENRTYRYFDGEPLFRFGHGLSYTRFRYAKAEYEDGVLKVKVKNIGRLDGDEVVQVYVRRKDDAEGPVMSLRGFDKVHIRAGETAHVSIPLSFDLFNPADGNMSASAGEYVVFYGGSSDPASLKSLDVTIK